MATPARKAAAGSRLGNVGPDGPVEIAVRLERDVSTLEAELAEIDMLIQQAHSEGSRHEAKRVLIADRIAAWDSTGAGGAKELAELNSQLLTLTRRAMVMESQVDVLGGKDKALYRYRDKLADLAAELRALAGAEGPTLAPSLSQPAGGDAATGDAGLIGEARAPLPPTVSRMVLAAQEDLRRDIARAMHDGPAQSLTNIVLQAQIVDRLINKDPASAKPEIRELISMVQSTLDATKSFIFDVRPMVLDDLGLMPTLRRAARDRGRRASIPVDFDSLGPDRRLPMELESGIFRILEEALAAYLAGRPDRVAIHLDWSDQFVAVVRSVRESTVGAASDGGTAPAGEPAPARATGRGRKKAPAPEPEMPAALAAMIEDRQGERAAAHAATVAPIALAAKTWRDIQARATTLGIHVELSADGAELRIVIDLPPAA
jgi:two-component system sensor histidine kinase DegS